MGFDFSGFVLRPAQNSPANASTTSEATTGVLRDVRPVPSVYALATEAPSLVDAAADQYRAAVLEAPGTSPTEYLLWAQNTSQLALLDDSSWWTDLGEGSIPTGTLTVEDANPPTYDPPLPEGYGYFYDGTDRVVVQDQGQREIGQVFRIVVARGDVEYQDDGWVDPSNPTTREGNPAYLVFEIDTADQTPSAGVVRLTTAQLALLGGGLSKQRGDRIIEVIFTVASARFWWTRNDRYEKRFSWNGRTQRWEPLKGGSPKNLGALAFDTVYQLNPKFGNLPINAYLPGDATVPDSYSMIRLGVVPGASSQPVAADALFTGIRIKSDAEVADGYDFSRDPAVSGVLGQTSGQLVFNPRFVQANAGKTIWYSYQGFELSSTGVVGSLLEAGTRSLFLAPVPGPTDYPLIRLGSRRPLQVQLVETDAALEALPPPEEGEAVVSLSTGRLLLSPADIAKADPTSDTFDKQFLGEAIIYDGVALTQVPQPTRAPVALLGANGLTATVTLGNALYIPNATYLPDSSTGSDPWRGLGRSGILNAPDGTGALPAEPSVQASVRPGGDTVGVATTGRVRQVTDGAGDAFLFSSQGALLKIVTVDSESELPSPTEVPQGTVYICKEAVAIGSTVGSKVQISREDRKRALGQSFYFLQAVLTPACYTSRARLISKTRKVFRFDGTETLYVAVDGVASTWQASGLVVANPDVSFFTATQVAESINAALNVGQARSLNERVVLESLTDGSVEIGFGASGEKDLSGAAALGFLPGWRAVEGLDNWLPDSGASFGLFRSPVNLDRSTATPDFRAVDRLLNETLQETVTPNPYVFLDQVPLQDVAGYDEGVFFQLSNVLTEDGTVQLVSRPLEQFKDIVQHFGERKFHWVERDVAMGVAQQPTSTLSLGKPEVVPESLLGAPGLGGGLFLAADGGSLQLLDAETDYVLPQGGQTGEAVLVERYGNLMTLGGQGTFTAGSQVFLDLSAEFVTGSKPVRIGDRLKLNAGDARGSYTILEVLDEHSVRVTPVFLFSSDRVVPWEVYRGFPDSVYDPAVVADVVYDEFNHLSSEPFKVRILTPLGVMPTSDVTRLQLPAMEALRTSLRPIEIRFGLVTEPEATSASLVALTQRSLGTIANNALTLPDSIRLDSNAFEIRLGAEAFEPTGVISFSADPGWGVEYLLADAFTDGEQMPRGRLKFGSDLLSNYASAAVWYVETFQASNALPTGVVEYDSITGDLNFSLGDMSLHVGSQVYLVEQMITEQRRDVAISPLLGSFTFAAPVQPSQTVETSYYLADSEGRRIGSQITEFLPVFIRDEVATQTHSNVFVFNEALRTVDSSFTPVVYVGPVLQNYGGRRDFVLDYPEELEGRGRLTFSRGLASHVPVKVTYAVYEAQGGELGYEASNKPLYRPPFFIKEKQDKFGLRGDRTSEFQPGQLLRIGSDCFYVRGTTYFPAREEDGAQVGDVTSVLIFPPTTREVGSRSPGNDVLTLITAKPVTTVVDPNGSAPVSTLASAGFMYEVPLDLFPFEPVTRGQRKITFQGNLMQFAVPGHLLEIGGQPFTITESSLNEDGSRTTISVAAPFSSGFTRGANPTVKLSCRPVYPPSSRDFLGVGPVLSTEPVELVLFGEETSEGLEKPGRTLISGVEYTLNADSGEIRFLEPLQAPLGSNQKLLLSFTRRRVLQPLYRNGALLFPRYHADFLHTTIPTTENGLLGGLLSGTYTFHQPDSFYCRFVPLTQFLGETTREIQQEIRSKQPASGALKASGGGTQNWQQGTLGLQAQRRHLQDKDRVARTFLSFYNSTILSFEQVLETISGGLIGDRDGKFRFWVGKGREYPTPGFEDAITGQLTPRSLWTQVFTEANPSSGIWATEADWVVNPTSASLDNKEVVGDFPDPDRLSKLIERQRSLVLNDVDDRLLIGLGRSDFQWFFEFRAKGVYARMGASQPFSRIFPQKTRAFFYTSPGIGADPVTGDPGIYTWGRMFGGDNSSTYGKAIGQLANPVLGNISNVRTANLAERFSRARVWGYFPEGVPANTFPGQVAPITEPCLIATPARLREFPVNPETGFPDSTKLLSEGGEVLDLTTGDPSLAAPPFVQGQQLAWGKPNGDVLQAYTNVRLSVSGIPGMSGLYVHDVLYGCVLRFENDSGTLLTTPDQVLVGTSTSSGVPAHEFPIEQGDTIFVVPKAASSAALSDPPSTADIARALQALPGYRTGFDLEISAEGEVRDSTWPSLRDPFFIGIKEILGQNPPRPLQPLEGMVEFAYLKQNPLNIPALQGQERDDAGDVQIPYAATGNTELQRFEEVSTLSSEIITAQNAGATLYAYPDEIVGTDGETVDTVTAWSGGAWKEPAALITAQDVEPTAVGHPTAGDPGLGSVEGYDLLLVQVEDAATTVPLGAQGILTVGAVETRDLGGTYGSLIEPPRFVTQTTPPVPPSNQTGSPVRYVFENAQAYITPPYPVDPQVTIPDGAFLIEDTAAGLTIIDLSSVDITLNDGATIGVGNLNDIWSQSALNKITLTLLARQDPNRFGGYDPVAGTVLLTLEIQGLNLTVTDYQGTPSAFVLTGAPVFGTQQTPDPTAALNRQIHLPILNAIPFVIPPAGTEVNGPIPYSVIDPGGPNQIKGSLYGFEFTTTVDTYSGGVGAHSNTAYIADDRLTFAEVLDMRLAKRRGFVHSVSGLPFEASLVVHEVTCSGQRSTVNALVNGLSSGSPIPFTFPHRSTALSVEEAGGTWANDSGATAEIGTIKVPAFEGWGNTPIEISGQPLSEVRFSAVPSCPDQQGGSVICRGDGLTESRFSGIPDAARYDNRIADVTVTTGSIENIRKGDLLVIRQANDPIDLATTKAGSYLVRYAAEATVGSYREGVATGYAGMPGGFVSTPFPALMAYNPGTGVATVDGHWADFTWPVVIRVYFILSQDRFTSSDVEVYKTGLISADVLAVAPSGDQFDLSLDTSSFLYADGTPLTASEAGEFLRPGVSISGFSGLPISVRGGDFPDDPSVVGWDDPGNSVYGFNLLDVFSPVLATGVSVSFSVAGASIVSGVPVGAPFSVVGVAAASAANTYEFQSDEETPVYENVPRTLYLDVLSPDWLTLNNPNGLVLTSPNIQCLLPRTLFSATFRAQAGIFLEPTFPRSVVDLSAAQPHVVDAGHNLPNPSPLADQLREIGMRDFNSYLGLGVLPSVTPENVQFEIRRMRRFQEISDRLYGNLRPLQYAYEIRRGRITATPTFTDLQFCTLTAEDFVMDWETTKSPGLPKAPDVWNDGRTYTGTNLGAFNDPNVGVNPGDTLRMIDGYGEVFEELEIAAVLNGSQLLLAPPGLRWLTNTALYVGLRFEIFLKRAPVPHEQSCEQLLELITDREILRTFADYDAGLGGYVPEIQPGQTFAEAANLLYDDLNVSGVGGATFGAQGVRKNDIVIVDPAGTIPRIGGLPSAQERGVRPFGDEGIEARGVDYTAGGPELFDDNRGFYRVLRVVDDQGAPHLEVTGVSTFAGEAASQVVFPEDTSQQSTYGYTVYPTVHDSALNRAPYVTPDPGAGNYLEGQMDLRPTKARDGVTQSFAGTPYSLRPFSYRIIRPSGLFSTEAVDLVLTMRERMLSLIELLRGPMMGRRNGSYWIFQRDEHLSELPNPTNSEIGLGLFTNLLLENLIGRLGVVPFSNTADCLSILDRRFWVRDERLDTLTSDGPFSMQRVSPGDTPYTAYTDASGGASVLPVLPDRVTEVLDQSDRFRALRYVWLAYRTHRILGTLAAIERFDAELPERMEELRQGMLQLTTIEKVES